MTQKFYYLSLFLGLVCGMCFTSCCDTDDVTPVVPGGGGEEVTLYLDNEALPAGIIDPTTGTIQLTEGGELTLPFVVEPAELASKIVLSSADPSIVEVNGMKLIAKKPGKTTIYATAGNYTMQYDVEVKEKENEKEVQIADTYLAWKADQLVETDMPEGAIVVTPSMMSTGANLVCTSAATFVIEGEVTLGKITLKDDVNLIIKDGAKLTVNQIAGDGDNINLHIFGQANQSGQLVVNSSDDAICNITTLEVHSAKVKATTSSNDFFVFYNIKTFNVYGGSVDAECTGTQGTGIELASSGSMNIYGGDVKAVGKGNYYGIAGSGSTVTVYGGKLWAENAGNSALNNNVNLTTGAGYTGTIRYSSDKTFWSGTADPDAKYVKVEKVEEAELN